MRKKVIKDYPAYEIYDDGQVYSNKRHKFLKPVKNNSGYDTVNLYNGSIEGRRSCSVHRLVAENFVKNPKGYKEINHKDGDKSNNSYTNLEWCKHPYNLDHAYENGLHTKQKAVKCLNNGQTYRSSLEAGRQLHCLGSMVSACCRGERKSHHGLQFEFV